MAGKRHGNPGRENGRSTTDEDCVYSVVDETGHNLNEYTAGDKNLEFFFTKGINDKP